MDRRDFFKTVFATPLLAPFLTNFQAFGKDELLLISENPEAFLPFILEELGGQNKASGRSFVFLNAHPRKTALCQSLEASGWTKASRYQKADLNLSFRPLQYPASPSFTVVRAGKILDLRSKKLFSFWKDMNENHPSSSCLTIATLHARQPGNSLGNSVRIYHNGRVVEEASLKKDRVRTFGIEKGEVTVKIEQGTAFVLSSSCRHKICCSVPPVSFTGDRIVCAPNHFLLEVRGAGAIDTIIG